MTEPKRPRGTDLNKFLVFVLRHGPQVIGVDVDPHGWADVDALIAAAAAYGQEFDRDALVDAVSDGDRRSLALSDDGTRIRATHGHSFAVDLGLTPSKPPAFLFRGIERDRAEDVLRNGLSKLARQALYLYDDPEKARMANVKEDERVVLTVDAETLAATGQAFAEAESGVWLTDSVGPEYLRTFEETDHHPRGSVP